MTAEYLLCFDFDQTIADTFRPSPKKIGVLEAYRFAIKSVFGLPGLSAYERIGGLQNRAPGELVQALLADGDKELLIHNAKIFFGSQIIWLNNLASRKKFIVPKWDEKSSEREIKEAISEMIILKKLCYLIGEIGTSFSDGEIWPAPTKGILEFFSTIEEINNNGIASVQLAILSSGHTHFVKKTFRIWNRECPKILVTDDDARKLPIELKDKIKPSRFLFGLVYEQWLKKRGIKTASLEIRKKDRQKIIYFGDDPIKDGKLAEITGILFGWFNAGKKENKELRNAFSFDDWNIIAKLLKQEEVLKSLKRGESLSKILAHLMAK